MKILLTGSTGFIGRNLKEAWRERYDLLTPSRRELDLLDTEQVEDYLRKNSPDIIVHAANTNDFIRPQDAKHVLNFNLRMFCNLRRCNGFYEKMYYFGSGAEYGMDHYIPKMEESYFGRHVPSDPYGFSKYLMAELAGSSKNIWDLRLFGVFGKYEERERRFLSNIMLQHRRGGPLRIHHNARFDYLYVNDLPAILEWFFSHNSKYRHYNVCSGKSYLLLDLAKMINEIAGEEKEIIVEDQDSHIEYTGSNMLLRREMGEFRLTPIRQAVEQLWAYYQSEQEIN